MSLETLSLTLASIILASIMNAPTRKANELWSPASASHPFERTSGECQAKSRFTLGKQG